MGNSKESSRETGNKDFEKLKTDRITLIYIIP